MAEAFSFLGGGSLFWVFCPPPQTAPQSTGRYLGRVCPVGPFYTVPRSLAGGFSAPPLRLRRDAKAQSARPEGRRAAGPAGGCGAAPPSYSGGLSKVYVSVMSIHKTPVELPSR